MPVADVAASFREAVVDVLVTKALAACADHDVPRLLLGGGVIANKRLRDVAIERADAAGVTVRIPPLSLCTDNGAMIAALASELIMAGRPPSTLGFGADSTLPVTEIQVGGGGGVSDRADERARAGRRSPSRRVGPLSRAPVRCSPVDEPPLPPRRRRRRAAVAGRRARRRGVARCPERTAAASRGCRRRRSALTIESAPAEPGTGDEPEPLVQWLVPEPRGAAPRARRLGARVLDRRAVVSLFVGWGFPIGLVGIVSAILALRRPLESRASRCGRSCSATVSVLYSAGWLLFAASRANLFG